MSFRASHWGWHGHEKVQDRLFTWTLEREGLANVPSPDAAGQAAPSSQLPERRWEALDPPGPLWLCVAVEGVIFWIPLGVSVQRGEVTWPRSLGGVSRTGVLLACVV